MTLTIFGIFGDTLDVNRRRNVHEGVDGDEGELIADGEVDSPCRRVKIEAPNGAVVAAVCPEAFAVVDEPDGGVVVLGAGEEEVAVPVVFEES
ncbi:unnamed protein product [Malus baccata var. baccata]